MTTTATALSPAALNAMVTPDVAADWQQHGVVWHQPRAQAVLQLHHMGLPLCAARTIYTTAWYKRKSGGRMARQSPFALTNPLHNFGHAISFITAQQMLRCFELWQPVAGTELLAWQLVAGHEMGHHHAERLKAKIAALSVANNGNKATGTGTIHATNQGAFAESQTDTSLATEAFCDSFGIMRLLRDKPASAARAAIQWQADFRRLGTFASVVAAAESYPQKKRGRAGFYFDVRYYTFGASDHALQNLKIWRAAARATKTEDQLAQATTAMLEPILPVIEMQARRFQTFALFRLNRPADRQQLATLIPNLTPATMLDRTVSPQTLLTESLHAG